MFLNNRSTPPVRGTSYAFILFFLNKYLNVQVPDEVIGLFNFSLGMLMFSGLLIGAVFNLFITLIILYYKDKYELELKFKNYPFLVRIIKFYQKASHANIIYEIIVILILILTIFFCSLYIILRILNKI
jgi:hypothetical protein